MLDFALAVTASLGVLLSIYLLTRNVSSSRVGHSLNMSPDTVSSLFPDRPIRPLPKRRLREKLSPDVADTIKYPPSTHETTPLFYYPSYSLKDEASPPRAGSTGPTLPNRRTEVGRNYTPRRTGAGLLDGEDEEAVLRSTLVTRSPPEILTRSTQQASKQDQARPNPQPPLSATSSLDGYDLFENTNNKKKRKIPSAGDATLNGTHGLHHEIGSLAISAGTGHSPTSELHNDRAYSHSGTYPSAGTLTTSQGISGPGRGRLGRARNGRSPLRALPDGNNSWVGRASSQWASSGKFITSLFFPYVACIIALPCGCVTNGPAFIFNKCSRLVVKWSIDLNNILQSDILPPRQPLVSDRRTMERNLAYDIHANDIRSHLLH